MRKSLIDSIGREDASRLMEDAVLRAVEENQSFGLVWNTKWLQAVGCVLHVIEGGRQAPLIVRQFEPSAPQSLTRQVPIA
ncbi:hypothetical protein A979_19230 [Pseudomonas syringae BRIP34876]|nr:hypothetical protein A979_19230 [Pseudomonas syringae BRIP34876]ELP99241.1 hypothetical protein A987_20765 [Pseudomonas syringae BRIP34881]